MLQYLFNATAIWLISLLVYDTLLRRESYHAYNRMYLLVTLLAGIVLPLVPLMPQSNTYPEILYSPVRTMAGARQAIATAVPAAIETPASNVPWVLVLYIIGMMCAFAVFVFNAVKLVRYHSSGSKQQQGRWTIIETGKGHAPFSWMHMLYVDSIGRYSAEEWLMVCKHEEAHTRLFHFADMLLLHMARIVFWFHPLVYMYQRRLLLVHEYQADAVAVASPQEYAGFLIEQVLLHAAPSVAHSFNYSPIKNRLRMLSYSSSKISRSKMLLLIPILFVFAACFAKGEKGKKMVQDKYSFTYPGTVVEMTEEKTDTLMMTDPVSGGEIVRVVKFDAIPVKVNGATVQYGDHQRGGVVTDFIDKSSDKMEQYLMSKLSPMLEKLEDGTFHYGPGNSIVSTDGKIVYYQFSGIWREGQKPYADTAMMHEMGRKVVLLMEEMPMLDVLKVSGKTVPYVVDGFFTVQVQGHKIIRKQ